jgi:hypothetical protein
MYALLIRLLLRHLCQHHQRQVWCCLPRQGLLLPQQQQHRDLLLL